ncbi:MAG TPA: hypothetical protein VFE78_07770 [Gemmataceae bacterium]|jgi:hypothetical protein|nr:hypothetical protein [Gemmataceae bacterium]
MKMWLLRLCVPLVLLGCPACGGPTSKIPTGAPDPKQKMERPPGPPPIPKGGPPKDAPRR